MYRLTLLPLCRSEIEEVDLYLSDKLQNPQAVINLYDSLEKILENLKDNPFMYPFVPNERLAAKGYRRALVKKYILFFKVKEDEVILVRFMHGSRDWEERLE